MTGWPDRRLQDILGIELPIIQAPMAGVAFADMVAAVSEAGGLGSLACAMLTPEQARKEIALVRKQTSRPINLNFFCHQLPRDDEKRETHWRKCLEGYYRELGIGADERFPSSNRGTFDAPFCEMVEEFAPEVVSFHFGLPEKALLDRVKSTGARVLACATTVEEARWLEDRGCDAIVAQGFEAGGHRGMFLTKNVSAQVGTMSLVPQVVDAVKIPVIAAGGIADARGIVAAFALGASAAQLGTAYLFCPEARISQVHREALRSSRDDQTALTNVFTGRPARGVINRLMREIGPMSPDVPEFPLAAAAVMPLRQASAARGLGDFLPLWSGQAAPLCTELSAGHLTKHLVAMVRSKLEDLDRSKWPKPD
jgi:nitronate monooxygenase